MPNENQELAEETRLMYVAMTRAMEQLIITCHRSSEFTNRIESALSKVVWC